MKTAIIGYSGSGKSTLARKLGGYYKEDVLHLDSVHFLPGWVERRTENAQSIVKDFLDNHTEWVIDGNYPTLCFDRRMEEADQIVIMLFNRIDCLIRVIRRFFTYRNRTRPDMAEGCRETMDREFVAWVLWKGRGKTARSRYKRLRQIYPDKVIVLKTQIQLNRFTAMQTASNER